MHVSGVALLKCVINLDGTLSDCRIMKGLPYMEPQLLEASEDDALHPGDVPRPPAARQNDFIVNLRVQSPG